MYGVQLQGVPVLGLWQSAGLGGGRVVVYGDSSCLEDNHHDHTASVWMCGMCYVEFRCASVSCEGLLCVMLSDACVSS